MDDVRRVVLTELSTFLHSNLVMSPYFYDTALQYGVFTDQFREILQEETPTSARSKLLEYLKKCSNEQYDAFLHVLKQNEIGQKHIAQQLEETEKVHIESAMSDQAKKRVMNFVQTQYHTNRCFTPVGVELITSHLVLKEDLNKALVQNRINLETSRRLKNEVLQKEEEILDMKDLLSKKSNEIKSMESQLNQLKTTLGDQMKKYGELKKTYLHLKQDYEQNKSKMEESPEATYTKETIVQNNGRDKNEIQRLKNDLKKINQKYEQQMSSIMTLNQTIADMMEEETFVKGEIDPIKRLQHSIKLMEEARKVSFKKLTIHPSENDENSYVHGENSLKNLQEKLNQEAKEKRGYKDKLSCTKKQLSEVRQRVQEMECMLQSCANSLSSGSRRCSLALEQMDSVPEERGEKLSLPGLSRGLSRALATTTLQLPQLARRQQTARPISTTCCSQPLRKSCDMTKCSVSMLKPKEFKLQLTQPTYARKQ